MNCHVIVGLVQWGGKGGDFSNLNLEWRYETVILEYRYLAHNQFDLKRLFVFWNESEKFLLSLKYSIHIITFFVT